MLSDLKESASLDGRPDRPLASRAHDISQSLNNWESEVIGSDSVVVEGKALSVARRERAIAAAVEAFAESPTQARLDHFNAAINDYNRLVR